MIEGIKKIEEIINELESEIKEKNMKTAEKIKVVFLEEIKKVKKLPKMKFGIRESKYETLEDYKKAWIEAERILEAGWIEKKDGIYLATEKVDSDITYDWYESVVKSNIYSSIVLLKDGIYRFDTGYFLPLKIGNEKVYKKAIESSDYSNGQLKHVPDFKTKKESQLEDYLKYGLNAIKKLKSRAKF